MISRPAAVSWSRRGWRAVLNEPVEEKEEDMTLLPDIVQGDELPSKGCGTEQKQTRPRPLHTESSLLAAMETADANCPTRPNARR